MNNLRELAQTENGRRLLLADIVREFGERAPIRNAWSDAIDVLGCGYYTHTQGRDTWLIAIRPDGPGDAYVIDLATIVKLPSLDDVDSLLAMARSVAAYEETCAKEYAAAYSS